MTLFDLFVLGVTGLSILFGWSRGLMREVVTLVALFGGIVVVAVAGRPLGAVVGGDLPRISLLIFLLFTLGFVAVHYALEQIARRLIGPDPVRVDRWLGGVLGLLRGWFLCGLVWFTVEIYHEPAPMPDRFEDAALAGFASTAAEILEAFGVGGEPAPLAPPDEAR